MMDFKNLPENWKVVKLGRVAEVIMGQSPPSSSYNTENIGIPFLQGKAEFGVFYPNPIKWCSSPIKIAQKEDVLISVRAPVGDVNIAPYQLCIGRGLAALRCKKQLLNFVYLFYYLKTNKATIEKLSGGSTFQAITKSDLTNFFIPLPPLPEQKRIVEILSLAEDLIKKQKEAIALIDKILMSKFLDMFGDPATNPKGWEVKEFKDVVDILDSKRIPVNAEEREKRKLKAKQLYPYYGANGQVDWIDDYIFDGNYLLIAEDGGFWGAFEKTSYRVSGKFWVNNHAHIVKGKKGEALNEYLELAINILDITRFMSGTTRGKLTQTDMKRILIPIPPLPLQQQFAQIVEEFEKKRKELQNTLETLESLFKLLQKRAFTGELTAEWREKQKVDWELPKITKRQAILLALLYYSHIVLKKPAMLTFAMKETFLLQKEAGLNLGYEFIPYKYGPFSKEVYEDLEELEKNLLVEKVKPSRDIEKTEVTISEDFKDWTEKLIDKLPENHKTLIQSYVQKYGTLSYNELIDYVYSHYPEFSIKSKKKRR